MVPAVVPSSWEPQPQEPHLLYVDPEYNSGSNPLQTGLRPYQSDQDLVLCLV